MINKNVKALVHKEMDRKEFLKYGAGVVLAVIGVTGLVNTLFRLESSSGNKAGGYGSSPYGR